MDVIMRCLKDIEHKFGTKTEYLTGAVSVNINITKKLECVEQSYFSLNFLELKKHIKIIEKIDKDFYIKLKTLHGLWIEEYNIVCDEYLNTTKKGIFKKRIPKHSYDKMLAYCDDLEITIRSIKETIGDLKTKIYSIQIQNFLNRA